MIAANLKPIYQAENADAAESALEAFEASEWGQKYPNIAKSWRRHWAQVIPFFCLLGTDPPGDLYNQRNRESQQYSPARRSQQGPFSARRRREETHLSGTAWGGR